jgi:hypothetical protein
MVAEKKDAAAARWAALSVRFFAEEWLATITASPQDVAVRPGCLVDLVGSL